MGDCRGSTIAGFPRIPGRPRATRHTGRRMTDDDGEDSGTGTGDAGIPPPPPSGWILPQSTEAPPVSLDVGLVVGRTFDTLGREWSLFLALAVPAGIGGFISGVLSPSLPAILRDGQSTEAQLASMALQAVVAILGGLTTLGTIVAADRLWRGESVGLGEAFGRAVSIVPRVIALFVVVVIATVGLAVAVLATT